MWLGRMQTGGGAPRCWESKVLGATSCLAKLRKIDATTVNMQMLTMSEMRRDAAMLAATSASVAGEAVRSTSKASNSEP